MSYTLPPISITQNQTASISIPGNLGTVSYVKICNASPYLLLLTNLLSGQDYLQPGECNVWSVPGLTTAIQATAEPFVSNTSSAPTSAVVVTWYGQGEQPSGSYPVNFNALTFNGGSVGTANQLLNTGNPPGQTVLEVEAQGGTGNNAFLDNTGNFVLGALSNNAYTQLITVVPGGSSTPAELQLRLLFVLGAATLDSGDITTDGAGNITVVSIKVNTPPTLAPGHQASGECGCTFTATAANQRLAVVVPYPLHLTNLPTSIVLSGSGANLAAGYPTTGSGTLNGFLFLIQSAAAGLCNWYGTYTTVGN